MPYLFSKNFSVYAIFNDQSFNNSLTNDIVSFVQLGPDCRSRDCEFELQLGHTTYNFYTDSHSSTDLRKGIYQLLMKVYPQSTG